MNETQYQYEQMNTRLALLEQRRDTESHRSFMGGGLGLFVFLFISMGFGILIWIISAISQSGRVSQLDREIAMLRSQIANLHVTPAAAIANASEAQGTYLDKLKDSFMHDVITAEEYKTKKAAYEAKK